MLSHRLAPFGFPDDVAARRSGCYRALVDRAAPLLDYDGLADLVRHHLLDGARVRVLRSGELVPRDTYTAVRERHGYSYPVPRPDAVDALLAAGATLVFNGLDEVHGEAAGIARDLEALLACPVRANVYASFSETPGFAMHWDDHDVLVTQVAGAKHWTFAPPSVPDPLPGAPGAYREPDRQDTRTEKLVAGDGLYLPRGWWHMAQASSGPSLHITWSLSRPTGVDFLSWFAQDAVRHPLARASLPLDNAPLAAVRAAVDAMLAEPDLALRYREHVAAQSPDRATVRFPR